MFREFSWKLLSFIISVFLVLKESIVEMILKWYLGEPKSCPPLTGENRFLSKSATELAALIRTGEITSAKLVEATIKRINEVNSILNAVMDGPFLEALDQAKLIDERIANKQISQGIIYIRRLYLYAYVTVTLSRIV